MVEFNLVVLGSPVGAVFIETLTSLLKAIIGDLNSHHSILPDL
jgi:hypothetical protein